MDIRIQAREYIIKHDIAKLFECMMSGLMYNRPDDHLEFLKQCLDKVRQRGLDGARWDLFIDIKGKYSPLPPLSASTPKGKLTGTTPLPGIQGKGKTLAENHHFVIALGGPGSHRTEVVKLISKRYPNFVHIHVGKLLRENIRKISTGPSDLWKLADNLVNAGNLAQDDTVCSLLVEEIKQNSQAKGFIIDGYPRSEAQMEDFKNNIGGFDFAYLIDFEEETLLTNMLNAHYKERQDQSPMAIGRRITTFKEKTLPMIRSIDVQGKLRIIDGDLQHHELLNEIINLFTNELNVPEPAKFPPMKIFEPIVGNQDESAKSAQQIEIKHLQLEFNDEGRREGLPQCPIVLFLGSPGCGRTEIASQLCKKYVNFRHISIGDILRSRIVKDSSDIWQDIATLVTKGDLVANENVMEILLEELKSCPSNLECILLEGFPKNEEQLNLFNKHIGRTDMAVLLDCEEQYTLTRLINRGKNFGRIDDNMTAIIRRISYYKDNTLPIVRHFDEEGRLAIVQADRDFDEICYDVENLFIAALFKGEAE